VTQRLKDVLIRLNYDPAAPVIIRVPSIITTNFYPTEIPCGHYSELRKAAWIPSMIARTKELGAENAWLKKMCIEEKLKADILNEAILKKW